MNTAAIQFNSASDDDQEDNENNNYDRSTIIANNRDLPQTPE